MHLVGFTIEIQGGSNMTGTDLCVKKCKQSRSYLNHLICYDARSYKRQICWPYIYHRGACLAVIGRICDVGQNWWLAIRQFLVLPKPPAHHEDGEGVSSTTSENPRILTRLSLGEYFIEFSRCETFLTKVNKFTTCRNFSIVFGQECCAFFWNGAKRST